MNSSTSFPRRPPRLTMLFPRETFVFFVTIVTWNRHSFLASPDMHTAFLAYARNAHLAGGTVTHYVLMPDHLHFFIGFGRNGSQLVRFANGLKRAMGKTLTQRGHALPHWQPGFFDHLLRHDENYAQKAEYIWNNPVRKNLVTCAVDWPFLGVVNDIPAHYMMTL